MKLLIKEHEKELIEKLKISEPLIICGPTGSGKSTQVPQILYKMFPEKKVAFIQPRRVATTSIFNFLKSKIPISYKIRHQKEINKDSKITIMTDGVFLAECLNNQNNYDVVIVDEVHERSVRTELILAILRSSKTKIILMSATIDIEKLKNYFKAEVFSFKGFMYPLYLFYETEPVDDYILSSFMKVKRILESRNEDFDDFLDFESKHKKLEIFGDTKILKSTNQIFKSSKKLIKDEEVEIPEDKKLENNSSKDILIFLPGEEDINDLQKLLKRIPYIEVFKMHSTMSDSHQSRIFRKSDNIKVILSTNICETSVTIPGVKYVIDCGLCKSKIFKKINYFGISKISKESADQRLGRANRTGPGVCYRLYTKEKYLSLERNMPEIQICNLDYFILYFSKMHKNFLNFNFLDFPFLENVKVSVMRLQKIGAIEVKEKLFITNYGKKLLKYPLDIMVAHFLEKCDENGAGIPGAILASLFSLENFNFLENARSSGLEDLEYLHNIFIRYLEDEDKELFCKTNKVPLKGMERAELIYKQISKKVNGKNFNKIPKIFSDCFAFNAGIKQKDGSYLINDEIKVFINPCSYYFDKRANKVVFLDILCTNKIYAKIVGKYIKS